MSFRNFLALSILLIATGVYAAPEISREVMSSLARKPRLDPDATKQRFGKTLAGVAYVKLKSGVDFTQLLIARSSADYKITGFEPLLPPSDRVSNLSALEKNKRFPKTEKLLAVVRAEEPLARTYVVTYDGGIAPEDFSRIIRKENPRLVESAEPYYVYKRLSAPNDPLVNKQKVLQTIKALQAWDVAPGNPNVIVGVSDAGTDQEHEDIAGSLATFSAEIPGDNQDNDGNGYVDDYNGYNFCWNEDSKNPGMTRSESDDHGMLVAGIIGATPNNGKGIAGVAGACKIFPIKIVPDYTDDIVYGYQSIIYAAKRGLKVLNCSWGSPKMFSILDQQIIDYALANDLAIVVSAGNVGSGGADKYSTFFPAGYFGVLGVGEVNQNDMVTQISSVSVPARIMAPGAGDWGTAPDNNYETVNGGTSFAAPVVSGALAIVRSKFPELTPIQAIELLRQTGDDISSINQGNADIKLIPKRVNLLNAVTAAPMSMPAILPTDFVYTDESGIRTDRFDVDQIVKLNINARNYLGATGPLTFTLSVAHDPAQSVEIVQGNATLQGLQTNEAGVIGEFQFKILQRYEDTIILRVDIAGENGYHDFFNFEFIPTKDYITFENEALAFSLSDYGEFGFSALGNSTHGAGFSLKGFGNAVYETSGLMATENSSKAVASFKGDFFNIKPFLPPNRNIGIVDDSHADDQNFIGLRISQEVFLPAGDTPYTKIRIKTKNMAGKPLTSPAVGYFLDWDIGKETDSNRVTLSSLIIPQEKRGENSAAMIAESTDPTQPIYAVSVYSKENGAKAQAAGLTYYFASDLPAEKIIKTLNSGTTIQNDSTKDISMVVGMKFEGEFPDEAERECEVCIAAAKSKQDLVPLMADCMNKVMSAQERIADAELKVYPQPARESINIELPYEASLGGELRVYDAYGSLVLQGEATSQLMRLDLGALAQGAYYVVYLNGSVTAQSAFTVIK